VRTSEPLVSHSPPSPQFVESKYHIELNTTAASQLNRAITSGSDKGIFNLPKGESQP
jgi:histone H1/5